MSGSARQAPHPSRLDEVIDAIIDFEESQPSAVIPAAGEAAHRARRLGQ
jgi:hypothetical protein